LSRLDSPEYKSEMLLLDRSVCYREHVLQLELKHACSARTALPKHILCKQNVLSGK